MRLTDVRVHYPGPPPVRALDGVTLTVRAGERVAVTGPSGSGKSTLLNTIGLLEHPTAGERVLAGHDTTTLGDRALARLRANTLGFVFQSFHLIPDRTAAENVSLALAVQRVPPGRRRARALDLLTSVDLADRVDAPTRNLSGGERQRVALARALAADPPLLLCDEPTGNLDSAATDLVLNLLADQHERGVTVVVVTHEPDVAAWAHRRVHVLDGHIDADDGPSAAHDPSHAGTAIRDVAARPLDPRPRSSSAPGRAACQEFPGGEPPRRESPRDDADQDA